MTLILQCLSDLTPLLSVRSNAAAPPGRQAVVICCPSEMRHPDTSIIDLYVLLNKWHNECCGGGKWLYFNPEQNVDCYWGREPYWWWLNSWELDSLLNLKGLTGLSGFCHKKDGYVCKYGIPDPVVMQNLHFHCVLWSGGLLCFDLVLRQTGISVKHSENSADISRSSRRLETWAPAVPTTQQLLLRQNDCCIFDALRRFQLVFGPWILRKLSSENKNHLCSSCRAETAQFPHPSVPLKSLTIFCAVGSNRTSTSPPDRTRANIRTHELSYTK